MRFETIYHPGGRRTIKTIHLDQAALAVSVQADALKAFGMSEHQAGATLQRFARVGLSAYDLAKSLEIRRRP